jgi:hypothetical protein
MNDSGAPLSAPDPSSFGGDFRRPPSLNHPPGSVGGIGNNNNYLSSSPTIGTPGLEDNPLKYVFFVTTTNACSKINL